MNVFGCFLLIFEVWAYTGKKCKHYIGHNSRVSKWQALRSLESPIAISFRLQYLILFSFSVPWYKSFCVAEDPKRVQNTSLREGERERKRNPCCEIAELALARYEGLFEEGLTKGNGTTWRMRTVRQWTQKVRRRGRGEEKEKERELFVLLLLTLHGSRWYFS